MPVNSAEPSVNTATCRPKSKFSEMHSFKKTYQFNFSDLNFDTGLIETLMGYQPGETDPHFMSMVEETNREMQDISDIKAEIRVFNDISLPDDGISLNIDSVRFDPGRIVCRQIRRSEQIAIGLCTAGKGITSRMKEETSRGDLLRAYIIDLFGSEIVDAALDLVQNDFTEEMNKSGLKITNRYSPGYCGWNTAEQHKLFSLFTDNFPGITLTQSALMQPVKSISCIIGVGSSVRFNPYTCGVCDFKDCVYRVRKDRRR
jgi:hypothetical protein